MIQARMTRCNPKSLFFFLRFVIAYQPRQYKLHRKLYVNTVLIHFHSITRMQANQIRVRKEFKNVGCLTRGGVVELLSSRRWLACVGQEATKVVALRNRRQESTTGQI